MVNKASAPYWAIWSHLRSNYQNVVKHISTRHGLSRDEYLKRWGLRSDHPLTAPAYSERRSTMAKALGLGRKPKAWVPPAAMPTAAPTPRRRPGRPRTPRS